MWGQPPQGRFLMADTINDKIEQAAKAGFSKVTIDGQSVEAMPIDDQIKAADYLAKQSAASKNHLGLAFRTLKPGGCGQ